MKLLSCVSPKFKDVIINHRNFTNKALYQLLQNHDIMQKWKGFTLFSNNIYNKNIGNLLKFIINSSSGTRNKAQVSGVTLRKKLQRITVEEIKQVEKDWETHMK